jgi:hypothetical protein
MKSEDVMLRLIKKYGIRRAVMLYGAASIAAVRGWDALVADDAYTRQGVWTWKRDLDAAGIDPASIELTGFEKKLGSDFGLGLVQARDKMRAKKAAQAAKTTRNRAST